VPANRRPALCPARNFPDALALLELLEAKATPSGHGDRSPSVAGSSRSGLTSARFGYLSARRRIIVLDGSEQHAGATAALPP